MEKVKVLIFRHENNQSNFKMHENVYIEFVTHLAMLRVEEILSNCLEAFVQ